MSEYRAIIINNQVAVINSNGENLFEKISQHQRSVKIANTIGKFFIFTGIVFALLFTASMSGFISEHSLLYGIFSVISLMGILLGFASAESDQNTVSRYQRQLNIACGEIEEQILDAKQRLLSQQTIFKKVIKEKETEDKVQFNF